MEQQLLGLLACAEHIAELNKGGPVDIGIRLITAGLQVGNRVLIGLCPGSEKIEAVVMKIVREADVRWAEVTVCLPNSEHCPQPPSA